MTVTAAQLSQFRRMIAEPTTTTYSDALLTTYIETYPLMDERGELPYRWDTTTEPPTKTDNDTWIYTYDLHSAAADIWEEKASLWIEKYNFSADGGRYDRNQVYDGMMAKVRYHRARRAIKSIRLIQSPEEDRDFDMGWIGNLPESFYD